MKSQEERGMLTENVQKIANDFFGENITREELRLYPYIDYCLKNCNRIERSKISLEEIDILSKRQSEGYLIKEGSYIYVSKKFYDYLQKMLAESYVEFKE